MPGIARGSAGLLALGAAHRELQRTILALCSGLGTDPARLVVSGSHRHHPPLWPSIDTAARHRSRSPAATGMPQSHRAGGQQAGLTAGYNDTRPAAASIFDPSRLGATVSRSVAGHAAPRPSIAHETSQVLRRLDDLNLQTLGSIAAVPLAHLESAFGATAGLLHNWALGIDPSPVRPPIAQPAIERSISLDPDEVDDQLLLGRLYGLLEHLCTTLRQQRRVCRRLTLTIRHSDHHEADRTADDCHTAPTGRPIFNRYSRACFLVVSGDASGSSA